MEVNCVKVIHKKTGMYYSVGKQQEFLLRVFLMITLDWVQRGIWSQSKEFTFGTTTYTILECIEQLVIILGNTTYTTEDRSFLRYFRFLFISTYSTIEQSSFTNLWEKCISNPTIVDSKGECIRNATALLEGKGF